MCVICSSDGCLKYVKCLNDFCGVNSCFSTDLYPNFIHYVNQFCTSFVDLKINIQPEVHAVFMSYHCISARKHRKDFVSETFLVSLMNQK